jgi:hypothetical protein
MAIAFVRYLPYLVLLLTLASLAGGTRLLARTIVHPNRATVKSLRAAAIAVAFAAGLASAFVVWGIQTAYAQAEAAGVWKEVEHQLEAYRAEHPAKQP